MPLRGDAMQINWFEIVAQIINFVVLLLILQKLFYKPIIKAMEERQARIKEDLDKADIRMQEADSLIATYENKLAEIEENEKGMLEQAKKEALLTKETLLKGYRNQADEKRMAYLNEMEKEKEGLSAELKKSLGTNAVKIASNILTMINNEDIRERLFDSFIGKIHSLSPEYLQEVVSSAEEDLILISSEAIPEEKRRILENALKEKIGSYRTITYKVDESLVFGYELKFETFTLAMNIKKYLEESEKNIMEKLKQKSG